MVLVLCLAWLLWQLFSSAVSQPKACICNWNPYICWFLLQRKLFSVVIQFWIPVTHCSFQMSAPLCSLSLWSPTRGFWTDQSFIAVSARSILLTFLDICVIAAVLIQVELFRRCSLLQMSVFPRCCYLFRGLIWGKGVMETSYQLGLQLTKGLEVMKSFFLPNKDTNPSDLGVCREWTAMFYLLWELITTWQVLLRHGQVLPGAAGWYAAVLHGSVYLIAHQICKHSLNNLIFPAVTQHVWQYFFTFC